MVLTIFIETGPRFCRGVYKIFGSEQSSHCSSFHRVVDCQGPWTSSQVSSCYSLLPKATVLKRFIVSLLEGSCQWWLQNVLWKMTSSTWKGTGAVAGIHGASYIWHLLSNRAGSLERVCLVRKFTFIVCAGFPSG